jgi:hypothetical protein
MIDVKAIDLKQFMHLTVYLAMLASLLLGFAVIYCSVRFRRRRPSAQAASSQNLSANSNETSRMLPGRAPTEAVNGGATLSRMTLDMNPSFRTRASTAAPSTHGSHVGGPSAAPVNLHWERFSRTATSVGVDLGSHTIKTHSCKGVNVQAGAALRCSAAVAFDGLVVGDMADILDHHDTAFKSVVRELAADASSHVRLDDIAFPATQALAGLLSHLCNADRTVTPLVGFSVAPYYASVAPALYAAAMAAPLSRVYIFTQPAALIAALLRSRVQAKTRNRPSRTVVFADCGSGGVSAYVCEVRETSGSVLYSTFREAGVRRALDTMNEKLCEQLPYISEEMKCRVGEAAHDLRMEMVALPPYLATRRVMHAVDDDHKIEMDADNFAEWFAPCVTDVAAVAGEALRFLQQHAELAQAPELVLTGGGFKIAHVREAFEARFVARCTSHQKISVSEGVALLTAMRHPNYKEQRYDIYPLYQLRTVDQSGLREHLEDMRPKGTSILSPWIRRSSSNLGRINPRGRSSTNSSFA